MLKNYQFQIPHVFYAIAVYLMFQPFLSVGDTLIDLTKWWNQDPLAVFEGDSENDIYFKESGTYELWMHEDDIRGNENLHLTFVDADGVVREEESGEFEDCKFVGHSYLKIFGISGEAGEKTTLSIDGGADSEIYLYRNRGFGIITLTGSFMVDAFRFAFYVPSSILFFFIGLLARKRKDRRQPETNGSQEV